jgi:hypothetical protein
MPLSSQNISLRALLETSSDNFLPYAFQQLTGRAPDFIGLLHYARRLHRGLSRLLILAELASSAEARAWGVSSPELELVVRRYLRVRDWPLGELRWAFLPKVDADIPRAPGFNWERWANDYIADQLDRDARQAVAVQLQREASETAVALPEAAVSDALTQRVEQLQHQLNHIVGVLQAQGVNVPVTPVAEVSFQLPDPAQISPQARQYFHVLAQELSV